MSDYKPTYQEQYREAHRDKRIAYAAEYYQSHKEQWAESQRKYYKEHKVAINARQKLRRDAHKVIYAQTPKCNEPKSEIKARSYKQESYHEFILELFGVKFQ